LAFGKLNCTLVDYSDDDDDDDDDDGIEGIVVVLF
jgi:hypothetical protein